MAVVVAATGVGQVRRTLRLLLLAPPITHRYLHTLSQVPIVRTCLHARRCKQTPLMSAHAPASQTQWTTGAARGLGCGAHRHTHRLSQVHKQHNTTAHLPVKAARAYYSASPVAQPRREGSFGRAGCTGSLSLSRAGWPTTAMPPPKDGRLGLWREVGRTHCWRGRDGAPPKLSLGVSWTRVSVGKGAKGAAAGQGAAAPEVTGAYCRRCIFVRLF